MVPDGMRTPAVAGDTELKNIFAALSSTYKIHIAKTIDRACYSEIR